MLNPYEKIRTLSEFDILDMESHGYNIKYINRRFILNISSIAFLEKSFFEFSRGYDFFDW